MNKGTAEGEGRSGGGRLDGGARTSPVSGKTYRTNTVAGVLGLSRGALRYYEQIGVLAPGRGEGSNYRAYSNLDVYEMATATVVKNSGFAAQDAGEILRRAEGGADLFERCRRQNAYRLAWHAAVGEALESTLDALGRHDAGGDALEPELVMAEEYLAFPDQGEKGYEHFDADPIQDALIRSMPVASFGSVIESGLLEPGPIIPRWCRMIATRHAALVPELRGATSSEGSGCSHVGGCACLRAPYVVDANSIPGFDPDFQIRDSMLRFAEEHGLTLRDTAFNVRALPARGVFVAWTLAPVDARTRRGRKELAKLGQS
ncbi:MAG: MerR family transcriptional regulator [Coriobacteriales bacterium]